MKKLNKIMLSAFVLSFLGAATAEASGPVNDVIINKGEGNVFSFDEVGKVEHQASKRAINLVEKLVTATAKGDFDKVAQINSKFEKLAVTTTQRVAEVRAKAVE